ncbi:hypothetical protein ACP70R_013637 [Stipagrostis hirtigluma subsp. patula]
MSYYNPHPHVGVPPPQGYPMDAYGKDGQQHHHHQHAQSMPSAPMGYPDHPYAQPYGYPPQQQPYPPYGQPPPPQQPYPPYAQPPPPPPPRHGGPSFAQGWLAVAAASLKLASDLGVKRVPPFSWCGCQRGNLKDHHLDQG